MSLLRETVTTGFVKRKRRPSAKEQDTRRDPKIPDVFHSIRGIRGSDEMPKRKTGTVQKEDHQ